MTQVAWWPVVRPRRGHPKDGGGGRDGLARGARFGLAGTRCHGRFHPRPIWPRQKKDVGVDHYCTCSGGGCLFVRRRGGESMSISIIVRLVKLCEAGFGWNQQVELW